MIASASLEVGELGPVVTAVSQVDGKYEHTYKEFDTDEEARQHFLSLVDGDHFPHESGAIYVAEKPDHMSLNMSDDGGMMILRYGQAMIGFVADRYTLRIASIFAISKMSLLAIALCNALDYL